MSVELHALMPNNDLPNRDDWQAAIDRLELPVQLYPGLDPSRDTGFSPCRLGERTAGFEIYRDSTEELASSYPSIAGIVQQDSVAISFRWGGDLAECACALAAASALASQFGAVVYYPADDIVYELDELLRETRGCLSSL